MEAVAALEAGAALDRLIAERWMGWKWYADPKHIEGTREYPHCFTYRRTLCVDDGGDSEWRRWSPSTDIAAAFEMECEIERRGLVEAYMLALRSETVSVNANPTLWWWAMTHASALQRCRAAVAATAGGE